MSSFWANLVSVEKFNWSALMNVYICLEIKVAWIFNYFSTRLLKASLECVLKRGKQGLSTSQLKKRIVTNDECMWLSLKVTKKSHITWKNRCWKALPGQPGEVRWKKKLTYRDFCDLRPQADFLTKKSITWRGYKFWIYDLDLRACPSSLSCAIW